MGYREWLRWVQDTREEAPREMTSVSLRGSDLKEEWMEEEVLLSDLPPEYTPKKQSFDSCNDEDRKQHEAEWKQVREEQERAWMKAREKQERKWMEAREEQERKWKKHREQHKGASMLTRFRYGISTGVHGVTSALYCLRDIFCALCSFRDVRNALWDPDSLLAESMAPMGAPAKGKEVPKKDDFSMRYKYRLALSVQTLGEMSRSVPEALDKFSGQTREPSHCHLAECRDKYEASLMEAREQRLLNVFQFSQPDLRDLNHFTLKVRFDLLQMEVRAQRKHSEDPAAERPDEHEASRRAERERQRLEGVAEVKAAILRSYQVYWEVQKDLEARRGLQKIMAKRQPRRPGMYCSLQCCQQYEALLREEREQWRVKRQAALSLEDALDAMLEAMAKLYLEFGDPVTAGL